MSADEDPTDTLPESVRMMRTVPGGLQSDKTRKLLDYWRQLPTGENGVPFRRDVDPIAIGPATLPHIFLNTLLDDGEVEIRLQGTYIEEQAGQTMTGLRVDTSTFGVNAPAVRDIFHAVRSLRRPIATHETVLTSVYRTILTEVVRVPLLDDSGRITRVLGALDRLDEQRLPVNEFFAAEWATIRIVEDI